ncbi:hypothetical protein CYMTET_45785 [Cymbomonas tetramitiformis]|uniref:Signal recognition particle receptor subunit beta n=1 Tax=Cymbomonas tetramitiformis TaxID=36881 RepID=A0AAE0BYP8_9CHLO|nr:hypothetical protein CYMTET_45785 [Cymbomonas tetramitiformis]
MSVPMELEYEKFIEQLTDTKPQILIFGLAICLFMLVGILRILFGGKRGKSFLLYGPSGSGKTSLFAQLKSGTPPKLGTTTSMVANEATFPIAGSQGPAVHVVDLPGHPRLRTEIDNYLPTTRALLVVIDSVDFLPTARNTAESIYELLAKPSVQKKRVPILVVCNKMDRTSAHSIEFLRKRLEKEIEQYRTTRSALKDTKESDVGGLRLTKKNVPFSFAICTNPIMFCGISVVNGDVSGVNDFIKSNA